MEYSGQPGGIEELEATHRHTWRSYMNPGESKYFSRIKSCILMTKGIIESRGEDDADVLDDLDILLKNEEIIHITNIEKRLRALAESLGCNCARKKQRRR